MMLAACLLQVGGYAPAAAAKASPVVSYAAAAAPLTGSLRRASFDSKQLSDQGAAVLVGWASPQIVPK